jgi:hypothetical protein
MVAQRDLRALKNYLDKKMRRSISMYSLLLHFLCVCLIIACSFLSWSQYQLNKREQRLIAHFGEEVEFMHVTLRGQETSINNLDDLLAALERIVFMTLSSKNQ